MPIKLLRENVDIYTAPILDLKSEPMNDDKNEHTIGDLHGNAIKLFYFLIKQGIIKNIDAKDYKKLVDIYKKPVAMLGKQDLNLFNKILKKIKCFENRNLIVRLIGDELADRGNNDYFTLKILQKLHQQGILLEILLSNHSAEFVTAYERQKLNQHGKFNSLNLPARFITSMMNLQVLIDKKLIDKAEIFTIYQTVYKPNLKLIGYTLHNTNKKKQIVLYTHAPAGLNSIQSITSELDISYKDGKLTELTDTIDNINAKFQKEYIQKDEIRELLEFENIISKFIWNRSYQELQRPEQKPTYRLSFVHGHDSSEPSQENFYNLDTDLGKCETCNEGEYSVLHIAVEKKAKAKKEFTEKASKAEAYSPIPYDPSWLPRHVSQDITTLMQHANTCRRTKFFSYKDTSKHPITPVIEVSQSINDAIPTLTRC